MIRPATALLWLGGLVGAVAGLLVAANPAFLGAIVLLLLALGCVAVLDALAATRAVAPITVRLHEGARQTKDRAGHLVLALSGNSPRPLRYRAALPLPASMVTPREILALQTQAGEWQAELRWEITPRKRGRFTLGPLFFTGQSPLGLWERRVPVLFQAEVRVYPNLLTERRRLAAMFMNRGLAGLHAHRRVGKGRDFEQLREYIPGDSYEDIHWKATARRQRPVTKIYQVERTQEVYVLVDVSRLSGRAVRTEDGGRESQLERFNAAALVLALVTQKQGDLFGLVTFSDRVHGFVRARARARRH